MICVINTEPEAKLYLMNKQPAIIITIWISQYLKHNTDLQVHSTFTPSFHTHLPGYIHPSFLMNKNDSTLDRYSRL